MEEVREDKVHIIVKKNEKEIEEEKVKPEIKVLKKVNKEKPNLKIDTNIIHNNSKEDENVPSTDSSEYETAKDGENEEKRELENKMERLENINIKSAKDQDKTNYKE